MSDLLSPIQELVEEMPLSFSWMVCSGATRLELVQPFWLLWWGSSWGWRWHAKESRMKKIRAGSLMTMWISGRNHKWSQNHFWIFLVMEANYFILGSFPLSCKDKCWDRRPINHRNEENPWPKTLYWGLINHIDSLLLQHCKSSKILQGVWKICARHWLPCHDCFKPSNDPVRGVQLLTPFYRWRNKGTQRLQNLLKVIGSDRAMI